ncbi:putative N-acetyltransferase domain-containing protein [Seiridium cardinale]
MVSRHGWKVQLIPWDHTSGEQITRLYDQRVACGWRADEVPLYIESARTGGRIFYWVTLADELSDRDRLLETHAKQYPKEATPIKDTAQAVRLLPRQPSGKTFIPIGHLALEAHATEEDTKLGLPSEGAVWIHQLYVSYALHRGGFGAGAMDLIEAVAAEEPWNATMVVLDTIQEEMQLSQDGIKHMCVDRGVPVPKVSELNAYPENLGNYQMMNCENQVSTQGWYARRGYEVFLRAKQGYVWNYGSGTIAFDIAYMRKLVARVR